MPIYEYKCDACGNRFEKLVRGSSPSVACPGCGGEKLEQQYSTFAAQMGGTAGGTQACAPMPSGGCGAGMCGMPGMCKN
ncbi:MAG TPA: zinc ribbon domain-containing protein [Bryobacteraceae bacterium]|nr:zinc ribbon domain-containing protein [Bryobacteraceae bacterium]